MAEIRNKTQIECIDGLEIELSARTDLVLIVEGRIRSDVLDGAVAAGLKGG